MYDINILVTLHPSNICNVRKKKIVRDTHLTIAAFLRMTVLCQYDSSKISYMLPFSNRIEIEHTVKYDNPQILRQEKIKTVCKLI